MRSVDRGGGLTDPGTVRTDCAGEGLVTGIRSRPRELRQGRPLDLTTACEGPWQGEGL